MKLITEVYQDLKYISENSETGKSLYIEGIFMESNKGNKNGRIYKKPIVEREVEKFQSLIGDKRSLGELGHPSTPAIGLNNVSHLITELRMVGEDAYGKAKILGTPMGKIAENLIKEGVKLGVSLRGLGTTVKRNGLDEVQDDFHLATIDIVSDPSAPTAFVKGVMESAEWVLENDMWKMVDVEKAQKFIKKTSSRNLEEAKLRVFQSFLNSIK